MEILNNEIVLSHLSRKLSPRAQKFGTPVKMHRGLEKRIASMERRDHVRSLRIYLYLGNDCAFL